MLSPDRAPSDPAVALQAPPHLHEHTSVSTCVWVDFQIVAGHTLPARRFVGSFSDVAAMALSDEDIAAAKISERRRDGKAVGKCCVMSRGKHGRRL